MQGPSPVSDTKHSQACWSVIYYYQSPDNGDEQGQMCWGPVLVVIVAQPSDQLLKLGLPTSTSSKL